jgi:hypothetical protein
MSRFVWDLERALCRVALLQRFAWYCLVELRP